MVAGRVGQAGQAPGEKIEFYKKVKAALEAGYYIVPPFPVDTFAIRVKDNCPPQRQLVGLAGGTGSSRPPMLPAGEGQYVTSSPAAGGAPVSQKENRWFTVQITHYRPIRVPAADFPFKLAKAEIMEATRAAMA
jgi:hypothetical protein